MITAHRPQSVRDHRGYLCERLCAFRNARRRHVDCFLETALVAPDDFKVVGLERLHYGDVACQRLAANEYERNIGFCRIDEAPIRRMRQVRNRRWKRT